MSSVLDDLLATRVAVDPVTAALVRPVREAVRAELDQHIPRLAGPAVEGPVAGDVPVEPSAEDLLGARTEALMILDRELTKALVLLDDVAGSPGVLGVLPQDLRRRVEARRRPAAARELGEVAS